MRRRNHIAPEENLPSLDFKALREESHRPQSAPGPKGAQLSADEPSDLDPFNPLHRKIIRKRYLAYLEQTESRKCLPGGPYILGSGRKTKPVQLSPQERERIRQENVLRKQEAKDRRRRSFAEMQEALRRGWNKAKAEREEHAKLWFNRVAIVLNWIKTLVGIPAMILAWNAISPADWYYRLLVAWMVGDIVSCILSIGLSPLGLLFWLIDSRFPCQSNFLKGCKSLLYSVIWVAILAGVTWFLLAHHVGNAGTLTEVSGFLGRWANPAFDGFR